ncbi:MAG: 30S ribosome-binding factor RbfA [Planctomycetota bacterium]
MNHRIEQVESTLKRVVSEVLQRSVSDPRIEGMVSITKINVSDDMAAATIYVSVLPAEKQRTTVKGLEHAAVHIHGLAKKKLALRRVPRFTFRGDDELKKQDRTLRAIREAMDRSGPEDEGGDAPPQETMTTDDASVAPGVGRADGAEDHA